MIFFIICIIVVIVALYMLFGSSNNEKEFKQVANNPFEGLVHFNPTKQYFFGISKTAFAVDTNSKTIALRDRYGKIDKIFFTDIAKCELIVNDNKIIEKSTMKVIGGALIGGAIAGGVGAIIGGLSSESSVKDKLSNLSIIIYTKDISHPLYKLECVGVLDNVNDILYPDHFVQQAREIVSIISIIIDECNRENNK